MQPEEIVMDKPKTTIQQIDVLVIGGGIAGEESALKLADTGYKVLIVEKDLSIGGKMILLSKVFPTLDCAACITTPKVSETARHPNISILTKSEVTEVIQEKNEEFMKIYSKMINRFTLEFSKLFCKTDGEIDWRKLVIFNSGRPKK